jgi:EpsD family peptidyl-prolyl cis-trans isomerase
MTICFDEPAIKPRLRSALRVSSQLLLCVAMFTAALVGCSDKAGEGASQVVAAVGSQEVTETQVNHALGRQPDLKPDQVETASRKIVSSLVDQEIVLQKARELKLERDQRVVQNVEAMKREIVARAYLDRIADGAAKPTAKEIQAYYDDNPFLFKQRRVYSFQELTVEATEIQKKEIEGQLSSIKSPADLEAFLKSRKIPVRSSRSTVNAENVPFALLQRVASLNAGQGLIVPAPGVLKILLLLAKQDSPVTEEQTQPAIAAFLLNQRKRLAVEREMAALRASAKTEYFGKYADLATTSAVAAGTSVGGAAVAAGRAGSAPTLGQPTSDPK